MKQGSKKTLNTMVEDHMTSVVRDSITMQRNTKRPRHSLHSSSINLALACLQRTTQSTTNTPIISKDDDGAGGTKKVDLNALLTTEISVPPPTEIGLTMHWLAVEGVQPSSALNPATETESAAAALLLRRQHQQHQKRGLPEYPSDNADTHANVGAEDSSIALRQLLPRLVSDELQLYFTRITHALSTHPESAIARLANDTGIQELVPFFTRYITISIHQNMHQTDQCRLMIQCIDALIRNGNLHLELHLDQILPSVLTCIVAKRIGSTSTSTGSENHWLLRDEAADVIVRICTLFGGKYGNLRGKVIQTLCKAVELDGNGNHGHDLGRWYGGIVGITNFGAKAVDAFILPLVGYWNVWEKVLEETEDAEVRFGLQRCQDALLHAMAVFFGNVSNSEQSIRLDYEKLSKVFGDRLVPLQTNVQSDYAACFV